MAQFVDVVLPLAIERAYTYLVPDTEEFESLSKGEKGLRVAVPFGKRKVYTALTYRFHNQAPNAYSPKAILEVLDHSPLITEEQWVHWEWIADYYMCTLGEVMKSALPSAFLLQSETQVRLNPEESLDAENLSDEEYLIWEALKLRETLDIAELSSITGRKHPLKALGRLLQQKKVLLEEDLKDIYKDKKERRIVLGDDYIKDSQLQALLHELARAPGQRELLMQYFQLQTIENEGVSRIKLLKKSKAGASSLTALIKKGVFRQVEVSVDRIPLSHSPGSAGALELSAEQNVAFDDLSDAVVRKQPALLHGVTASGKTEVFVKLAKMAIERGQQVLYLLPEIALTVQLIQRLRAYLGGKVVVYHSRFSRNEQVEMWMKTLAGGEEVSLIVGARSALFLPFQNLGLIVVDEEHESSFKQFDPAPRYHGRDAAVYLAQLHQCGIVLGTATPSLESYYNAQTGKYSYSVMNQRFKEVEMPDIELVSLKEARRKKQMKGHFTPELLEAIENCLQKKEQIILFQNRRGYSPVLECEVCGHSPGCPNCDVKLTYHQNRQQLRCHYCGYKAPVPEGCEACGTPGALPKGLGTQQVEEEVKGLFPDVAVKRMDQDTTRGKNSLQRILHDFEQQEIKILIGTQMVTKGLDFERLGLVGVMSADSLMNFPDYRAHERAFQLLMQVAGRAGRAYGKGRVVIQTYQPEHPLLIQLCNYDYSEFFAQQLQERKLFDYPPYIRVLKISLKSRDYSKVVEGAQWLEKALRQLSHCAVLGPEFPLIPRIRNQYIQQFLIKSAQGRATVLTKQSVKRIVHSFHAIAAFRSIRLVFDVDHI